MFNIRLGKPAQLLCVFNYFKLPKINYIRSRKYCCFSYTMIYIYLPLVPETLLQFPFFDIVLWYSFMILEKEFKSYVHPYSDVNVKFSLLLSINFFSYALYMAFFSPKNSEWNLKKEIQDQNGVWKVTQVNMTVTILLQI